MSLVSGDNNSKNFETSRAIQEVMKRIGNTASELLDYAKAELNHQKDVQNDSPKTPSR